jgi:hypothetical protein
VSRSDVRVDNCRSASRLESNIMSDPADQCGIGVCITIEPRA